ncbi:S-layer homology domain-containing protein [Thermoanaerobacterium saccharolyticum]
MKRILSWLLVLTFIFTAVIPVSASMLSSNDINQELGVTNTSSDSSSVQSSVYSSVYDSVYNDEQLAAHDYIFYYVDCGDQTPSTPDPGDKIGLYQSVTDKEYGVDTTGYSWGYGPETDVNGSTADKYSSVRFYWGNTHNADTSVSYRFQLSIAGYYLVTIATKNPWGTRDTNIYLEGVNKSGDFTIPQNTTVEVTYRVYVDDGELNVDIKGPSTGPYSQYNDPMVGFIAVEGVIPISYLQSQISTLNTEINKKKEDGSNYYTVHSINEANTAIYEAQIFIDNFNPQVDDIASENVQLKLREELNKIKNAFADLVPDIPNTVFKPGQIMRDTNGVVIDAHGGYIMYDKITKKYYWYGEYHEGKWPSSGVRCYSSTDLLNWKDEGMALTMIESMDQFENDPLISELYKGRTDTDSIFDDIRVGRIIERPRVIYNDKTKKYVMWMHVEGSTNPDGTLNQSYAKAQAGVAESDSPTGPFEYLHSYRMDQCPPDQTDYHPESKGYARDLTLFKDDDGSAYLIYSSEENYTIYISKLTPDYTDITGWHKDGLVDENGNPIRDKSYKAVYGVDYVRVFPGEHREAPAMFKYDGKYYLLTSGATGWAPNENEYAVADNIFGPWSTLVNPFVKTRDTDPDPMKAFNSQTTCVIPVDPQKGKFIYVGDMWNGGDFSNDGAKYVFLPIEFGQGSDMIIRWYDSWDPSILDSMGKVNIETKFPEAVALGTLPNLPAIVDILDKSTTISTPAIWTVNSHTPTVADFSTPGQVTLELKLPDYNNKVVYVKMYVIPDKTIYFVNCGGYVTSDYSLLTSYMQNTLINKGVADQAYNPDDQSSWGYIGNDTLPSGSNSGDIWSTVRYLNGGNISNSPKGTDLSYQFTLENGSYDVYIGFNDPWTNISRKANLVINGKVKGPITFTPQNVQAQKGIEVTDNSLNITVRNTAAQDPLISWIMIVDNDLVPSSDPTMGLTGSSPSPTTVNLTWHKILGATGYTLYRSDNEDGTYEPIYSGNAGIFTDTNLQPNRTYYYKVSYTNDAGEESPLSAAISVTTKSDIPTSLIAYPIKTAQENEVTCAIIKWDPIVGASQYILYRANSSDGTYSEIYRGYAINYMDTGLKPGATYYYKVKAVTSAGESGYSTAVSVKIPVIGKDAVIVINGEAGANDVTKLKLTTIKVGDKYYRYDYNSVDGKFVSLICSSSTDLINWTKEKDVLTASSHDDLQSCKLESINILYNEKTKRYVMWAHYENAEDYSLGRVLVAVSQSDSPSSEFTVVGQGSFRPLGNDSRDISIFKDDDGSAYLISATNTNADLAIYKLTDDYLGIEKLVSKPYKGLYREAPGMVKIGGIYYLFTSAAAGWYPSQAMYSTATSLEGPWSEPKPIGNSSTFSGQSNAIIKFTGTETTSYFAVIYRWLRGDSLWLPVIFDGINAYYDYCDSFLLDENTGQSVPITNGVLLSEGKPARASKSAAGYGPEKANDGDYLTAWQSERNYDWPQWWEVDLGAVYDLANVQISWWILKGSEGYYKYTIQTKKDVNDTYTTVLDRTDNQFYGFTSDNISCQARYVRINLIDAVIWNNPNNNWYTPQLMEVKIFGYPIEIANVTAQDVADKITTIPAPAKGATRLTLPTVPDGFSIAIKSSDNPTVIGTDGIINPPSTDMIVHLVLEVTRISDGSKATTTSIAVVVPGKTTGTTHTGGSSGNGSTINNNGSTMNEYGTISITDNTTTLTLDVSKTLAAINNTQGSQFTVDLTSIGTTNEKVTKIPKEVINAAKDSGKDIVIKSDNTQLVLSKDFIDLNNVSNSIIVSIKDKGKTNVANYTPLSNTLDISIKSENGNIAINKPVEVTLNISNVNDPRKAAVYYYNNTTGEWEYVGGKVNKADNTITFSATHFSQYAAFEYDKTFNDIKNHWAKDDIEVLASKHIVEGVDANNFAPDKTITRAEFAAMMIRLLGIPEETYKGEFSDVKTGDWYANAIEAAYKAGIILGDGSNMRPNDKITREEMAAIAMRVYGKLAAYNEEQINKTTFSDDNIISDWAKNAVANAVKQHIINGEPNNMFAPKGNATRAEAAAVLYNLLDKSNNI